MTTTSSLDIDYEYLDLDETSEIVNCYKCNTQFIRKAGSTKIVCDICLGEAIGNLGCNPPQEKKKAVCDCGAEKVYGKGCSTHSYWCSIYQK